jgi:hypothetical protein
MTNGFAAIVSVAVICRRLERALPITEFSEIRLARFGCDFAAAEETKAPP